jgi:hypothetical protein
MYSSRRYNVKRYIQNLHSGGTFLVSFVDYLVGRQSGYYLPSFPPTYETKPEQSKLPEDLFLQAVLLELLVQYLSQESCLLKFFFSLILLPSLNLGSYCTTALFLRFDYCISCSSQEIFF